MKNSIVRKALHENKVFQWELAKELGISENTLCRKMREELPAETQRHYVSIIERRKEHDSRFNSGNVDNKTDR